MGDTLHNKTTILYSLKKHNTEKINKELLLNNKRNNTTTLAT